MRGVERKLDSFSDLAFPMTHSTHLLIRYHTPHMWVTAGNFGSLTELHSISAQAGVAVPVRSGPVRSGRCELTLPHSVSCSHQYAALNG